MNEGVSVFLTIAVVIAGGVVLLLAAMNNRRKIREMAHRERLAMIERGLIPSPEADPQRFEAAAGLQPATVPAPAPRRGERFRTIGVSMIGFGVGLGLLIAVTGDGAALGFGIGGAWVALGAASLLNYFLISREGR